MIREYLTSFLAVAVILAIVYMGYRNERNIEKIEGKFEDTVKSFFSNNLFKFSDADENGDFSIVLKDSPNDENIKISDSSIEISSLDKTENSKMQNNIDDIELTPSQVEEIVKNYIEKNPEIIANALDRLQQIRMDEMKLRVKEKIQDRKSDLENNTSPFIGNKNGKSIIVMFFDYNCGYCKQSNDTLVDIIESNKDVKVILKIYPILGNDSEFLAKITTALFMHEPKKFRTIHDVLMSDRLISKDDLIEIFKDNGLDFNKYESLANSDEVAQKIKENIDLAKELRINGVPAFIINGEYNAGYLTEDQIKSIISDNNKK